MRLSICTYTYNDGNLLDGLLIHLHQGIMATEASRKWSSVQLVVMDDGSVPPYELPSDLCSDDRIRLLRHSENLGFHRAKGDCLNAATGDVIFALDCDARPGADWLEVALPHLDDPKVALVGGAVSYHDRSMGHGPTARYLNVFDGDVRKKERGPVDMVPGQAWLIRGTVWREVEGFGHNGLGCLEDHALGSRLRRMGYTLMHEPDAHSFLVRRLSRRAMVKRFWAWLRHLVPDLMAQGEDPLMAFLVPMMSRLETAMKYNEPVFAYLEMLYLAHAMHDARRHAPSLLARVTPRLMESVRQYPQLSRLLRLDLLRMGIDGSTDYSGRSEEDNHSALIFLDRLLGNLEQGGILSWLESEGVPQLLEEESEGESSVGAAVGGTDFSVYESW